jgi:hypothetical protein
VEKRGRGANGRDWPISSGGVERVETDPTMGRTPPASTVLTGEPVICPAHRSW